MTNRQNRAHEAIRFARWLLVELGRELRVARLDSGLIQAEVGRHCGRSASWVSRVEHGQVTSLTLMQLARVAASVGLKPSLSLWPASTRLLDRPQLEVLQRFNQRLHSSFGRRTEVVMPIQGDLRAADEVLSCPEGTAVVEVFSRFHDFQAQSRKALAKKRDLHADRLLLVLSATNANRRALAEAGPTVRATFPVGTRSALAALGEGRLPADDAVVLI